jgi:hypothetical protein
MLSVFKLSLEKMMPFDLLDANITIQTANANQNLLLF